MEGRRERGRRGRMEGRSELYRKGMQLNMGRERDLPGSK